MERRSKRQMQAEQGWRLRLVREVCDLSQEALGQIMGVGSTTIQGWEKGRNQIDIVGLAWAAEHLGISTDFIISGKIDGVRFDLAVKIQELQRRYVGTPPARRGPKPKTPIVAEVPDNIPSRAPRYLHSPSSDYLPPPQTHDT